MTYPDYHGHVLHECGSEDCFVCRGGLALCTVCGGAEASMPTACPGRQMTSVELDDVQAGRLDYTGTTLPLRTGWEDMAGLWRAWRDGREETGPYGEGPTKAAAIEDLRERESENG